MSKLGSSTPSLSSGRGHSNLGSSRSVLNAPYSGLSSMKMMPSLGKKPTYDYDDDLIASTFVQPSAPASAPAPAPAPAPPAPAPAPAPPVQPNAPAPAPPTPDVKAAEDAARAALQQSQAATDLINRTVEAAAREAIVGKMPVDVFVQKFTQMRPDITPDKAREIYDKVDAAIGVEFNHVEGKMATSIQGIVETGIKTNDPAYISKKVGEAVEHYIKKSSLDNDSKKVYLGILNAELTKVHATTASSQSKDEQVKQMVKDINKIFGLRVKIPAPAPAPQSPPRTPPQSQPQRTEPQSMSSNTTSGASRLIDAANASDEEDASSDKQVPLADLQEESDPMGDEAGSLQTEGTDDTEEKVAEEGPLDPFKAESVQIIVHEVDELLKAHKDHLTGLIASLALAVAYKVETRKSKKQSSQYLNSTHEMLFSGSGKNLHTKTQNTILDAVKALKEESDGMAGKDVSKANAAKELQAAVDNLVQKNIPELTPKVVLLLKRTAATLKTIDGYNSGISPSIFSKLRAMVSPQKTPDFA
jgi:HJR/Mrr/RecB family endonuclease